MFEEKLVATYSVNPDSSVDTEDSVATTKEEEWVTKKKTDIITTRQIETRVKRQLVVEDGKIVEDSGPLVTTNTTEDTEKQEHSLTEHRALGEDNASAKWIEVSNPKGCVKEVEEKTVKSRQETEERVETENVKHLGDISDEGYLTVIKSGSDDFHQALQVSNKKGFTEISPKIIHQSQKTKKYIDKEDKIEQSSVQPGGKIINETKTTLHHEELGDYNISDDNSSDVSFCEKTNKENFQRYCKTKEQDITEYIADGQKIGERLHYQAENSEGERLGDFFDEHGNLSNLSSKLKLIKSKARNRASELQNEEFLLKQNASEKLSSFDQEEEAKKAETSKWLEYHFGSESTKSSNDSFEDFENIIPSTQNSFIHVTMKSQPLKKNLNPRRFSILFDKDESINNNFSSSNDYCYKISEKYGKKDETYDNYKDSILESQSYQDFLAFKNGLQNSQEKLDSEILSSSPVTINEIKFIQPHYTEPYQKILPKHNSERIENIPANKRNIKISDFKNYRKQVSSSYQYDKIDNKLENEPLKIETKIATDDVQIYKEDSSTAESLENKETPTKTKFENVRAFTSRDNNAITFDNLPKKKLYQRTRFAADIPLSYQQNQTLTKPKNKISESFRRLMSKLKSNADTKSKKRLSSRRSRSPSPNENTYENYNSLDNYESLMTKTGKEAYKPVAPFRTKYNNITSQPLEKKEKLMQRYYLGEDPFSSSIYGKEKEYEHNYEKNQNIFAAKGNKSDVTQDIKTRTLGRFSKSTSKLLNSEKSPYNNFYDRGGIKTLPRKFLDETEVAVFNNNRDKMLFDTSSFLKGKKVYYSKKEPIPHTSSMINVSIVNKPQDEKAKYVGREFWGPAKPVRTYRANLSRSHSFNIQPENTFLEVYKSNTNFQSLKDSPTALKSPGIISEWSQNSGFFKPKKSLIFETKEKKNLRAKKYDIQVPELFETNYKRDYNQTKNINMNFPNDEKSKQEVINYNNSFRSTTNVNMKDTNSGEEILQKRHLNSSWSKPSKIPTVEEFSHCGDNNETFSKNEDWRSNFTKKKASRSDYPIHFSHIHSSEVNIPEKIVESRLIDDTKKFCNNNNSNGVVIKVLNCKN